MILLTAIIEALGGGGNRVVTPPPVDPYINLDNCIIVCDGDSKTQGDNTWPYPAQLAAASPFDTNGATVYNLGVNGQGTSTMISDAATQVDTKFVSGVRNFCICWELGNDLASGTLTSQQAVDYYETYCNGRKAVAGMNVYMIVCTDPLRDGVNPNFNLQLSGANTILRNTWSNFADALVDLAAIPGLDPVAHPENFLDGTHPNTTGQTLVMNAIKTAILAAV